MNLALCRPDKQPCLLTNTGLNLGDHVFPMVHGIHKNGKFYVAELPDYDEDDFTLLALTGWPSEPHTIEEFYQHDGIPYIRTDHGYSPAECYFKLIDN